MDDAEWPLIARIYADEAYRARYNTYLGEEELLHSIYGVGYKFE